MSATDAIGDLVGRVLGDGWQQPDTAEQHVAVWERARELGWHLLGADERSGGVGGTLDDRRRMAELLGAHGQPGPYLESNVATVHLGGSPVVDAEALARGGVVIVPADDFGARTGRVHLDDLQMAERVLVAGDRLHEGVLTTETVPAPGGDALRIVETGDEIAGTEGPATAARRELDLLRCARLVGACHATARLSARHASEREQFGRPLLRFQAVGALIAEQRAAAELAGAALDGALAASTEAHGPRADAAVWAAVEAAGETARLAHQVHGAMGFTREHPLHRLTRRLWTWRDQLGAQRARADRLGRWATETPEPDIWRLLSPDSP